MSTANGLADAINFMIPAVGTPRMYFNSQVFSATPFNIDFSGITGGYWDGQPFRPSGVYIDNSAGAGPLTIVINQIAFSITCPAGGYLNLPFPAPVFMTCSIVGNGQATVVFVDVPVMPYRSF
jgi:hypothetical protein